MGFIPSEFQRVQGDGEIKTIFFCDSNMVPNSVPDNTLFVSKEKAQIHEFTQLITFFDDSFTDSRLNFVVFCLGSSDISHADKQLVFNDKLQSLDYHVTKNREFRYVSQCFNVLLSSIVELKTVDKLISFDVMSRSSSGFHNAGVEFINRRVEKVNDVHAHYNTWKRYQQDMRKRKDKETKNFPIRSELFDDVDNGILKSDEKDKLAAAAVDALSNEGNLVIRDATFLRKF